MSKKTVKQKLNQALTRSVGFLTMLYMALFATNAMAANNNDSFDMKNLVGSGDSVLDVNDRIGEVSRSGFNMVKIAGVFVGICFIFAGLIRLKKSQDQNSGVSPMQGIALLIIGGLFGVLPWLMNTSANTVTQGSQSIS